MTADLLFDPAHRELARTLHEPIADLPLVCPHTHVDPWLLADPEATLGTPAQLFVIPDHYVLRLLHSQGVALEHLGVPARDGIAVERDHRRIWQRFAERLDVLAATPTGLWLSRALRHVFGVERALSGATAQLVYDELEDKLARPEFAPRALLDRFGVEVLCTTDAVTDDLAAHRALHDQGWNGRVRPTLRADALLELDRTGWAADAQRLGELTGVEVTGHRTLIAALEARRDAFRALGAVAVDVSVTVPRSAPLTVAEAEVRVGRALRGQATHADAQAFAAHLLMELARMSREDGLVLQLHAGSLRNHHRAGLARFGPDIGADIPVATEWTRSLQPLLSEHGDDPALRLIAFTLDESTLSRELAPLAGYYPALQLGAPWWFLDSPGGIRRFLDAAAEVCGVANLAGFVDDTRAFASIPARHDVWRRVSADWLAGLVLTGRLDEPGAHRLARELAVDLARRAYRLDAG
ncbi:MAG: glucuronate isomerase [Solirubrobacteraceae bacterium]